MNCPGSLALYSNAAENVYHMLSSELLLNAAQKEAYPNAADYIYLGILHDTGGLARANQGIFQAVADLMAMGVDHGRIMKTLHSFPLKFVIDFHISNHIPL